MSAMTVMDLMSLLSTMPEKAVVVLSRDGEGNSFSPIPDDGGYSEGIYVAENSWSGDVLTDEDIEDRRKEDEDPDWEPDGVSCIILWPTN